MARGEVAEWRSGGSDSAYQTFLADFETKLQRDEVIGWFGNRQTFLESPDHIIRHHQVVELISEDDDDDQTCQVSKT